MSRLVCLHIPFHNHHNAETVMQLHPGSWYYLKRYGAPPCHDTRLWGDIARTPLPMGVKAEGRARTWLGRNRRTTGRQALRRTASQYRERRHETWPRGQETAVPALKAALLEGEPPLGWRRERRAQMVRRLAGGLGTPERLKGLLRRGSQVVAQSSHQSRVPKVRPAIGPWHPTSRPGRAMAALWRPQRFGRATRQGVRRTPQEKGGDHSAVLRTTGPAREPTALAEAYDGRAVMEATLGQAQPARGIVKRRQHTWAAPPMGLL